MYVWRRAFRAVASSRQTALLLQNDVARAWEKAGVSVGWLGPKRQNGWWEFNANRKPLDVARSVPAFKIHVWREGMLAKLPVPARAFGLDLSYTALTDAGLKELAGLKHLTALNLRRTQVTDAGLKELPRLKQLTWLNLTLVRITDAMLKDLAGLKELTFLSLHGSQVTDAGLKELAGLKQLTTLYLSKTNVTDAGLKELAGLKQLTALYLGSTDVTDAGTAELREALPDCKISQ